MRFPVRIGSRGSPLALRQAEQVRADIMAAHQLGEDDITIEVIRTTGDKIIDRPLADIGGKELFTKEIEDALLAGRIDIAVHSGKDMPALLPAGLAIIAFLPREDVRDAFISLKAKRLDELRHGALVGTASVRRAAQLRHMRPDLEIAVLRGNVETRLRKLSSGEVDATFLALAGLKRLGLADKASEIIDPEVMLPAVAQGAICVEARADDSASAEILAAIHHADTSDCVSAERAYLAALDGSCRTPIAGLARIEDGGQIVLSGEVLTPDGALKESIVMSGPRAAAEELGHETGTALKTRLGPEFLRA